MQLERIALELRQRTADGAVGRAGGFANIFDRGALPEGQGRGIRHLVGGERAQDQSAATRPNGR